MKYRLYLFYLLLLSNYCAFCQSDGFFILMKDTDGKTWRVGDVVETNNSFIFSLRDRTSSTMKSKLVKISLDGVILAEKNIDVTDTTVNLAGLFPCPFDSNVCMGLGVCFPPNDTALLMTLFFDYELNEICRSFTSLPNPEHEGYKIKDFRFLKANDCFFALLYYDRMPTEKEMKLCRISTEGDITLVENVADSLVAYGATPLQIHDYPNGLGLFVPKRSNGTHVSTRVLIYDQDLQLNRTCDITNWYEDDGQGNVYMGNIDAVNSMILLAPSGGYYISSRFEEHTLHGSTTTHDKSSLLAKTDTNFNILPQHCITEHLNDTIEIPSFYKSVDFNEEGMVFQCSMQNINFDTWPFSNEGTNIVVTKTDSDLEIVWKKRFFLDGNVYSTFQTKATSDGGCLIVGNVYDHNPERRQDVFVLKITSEGLVGFNEIQNHTADICYPNPTRGNIKIKTKDVSEIQVFNVMGRMLKTYQNSNEINVCDFPPGIYLLRIIDRQGVIHKQKIIVE